MVIKNKRSASWLNELSRSSSLTVALTILPLAIFASVIPPGRQIAPAGLGVIGRLPTSCPDSLSGRPLLGHEL